MTKSDCESAIRHLCDQWAEECGIPKPAIEQPSFADFKRWLSAKGHSHCLNFKSAAGPDHDAELWFDDEFGQTWRN